MTSSDDIWSHTVIWYKYNTIFRPWLVNEDGDICCALRGKCFPGLMILLGLKSVNSLMTESFKSCPFNGTYGIYDADMDAVVSKMFPQVIPDGEYKIMIRIHSRSNETIWVLYYTGTFRAKDTMKRMLIG